MWVAALLAAGRGAEEVPLDEDLAAPILRFFRLRAARAGRKGQ